MDSMEWAEAQTQKKVQESDVSDPKYPKCPLILLCVLFGRVGVKGMNIGILFCGLFEDAAGDYVGNSMHWTIYCLLLSQL